jgi:hypothetical protein
MFQPWAYVEKYMGNKKKEGERGREKERCFFDCVPISRDQVIVVILASSWLHNASSSSQHAVLNIISGHALDSSVTTEVLPYCSEYKNRYDDNVN